MEQQIVKFSINQEETSLIFEVSMENYPYSWCNLCLGEDESIVNLGGDYLYKIIDSLFFNLQSNEFDSRIHDSTGFRTKHVFTLKGPLRSILMTNEDMKIGLYIEKGEGGYEKKFLLNKKQVNDWLEYLSAAHYLKTILIHYKESHSTLHYHLDNTEKISQQRHVEKELQYLKNNWDKFKNNVKFYENGKEVSSPW